MTMAIEQGSEIQPRILCADVVDRLQQIEPESVQLILADPPYNICVDYGRGKAADQLPDDKYLAICQSWMSECVRVLSPGGSLWVLICERWADQFGSMLSEILSKRNRIIWREAFARYQETNFTVEQRHLFYYARNGAPHTWNPDPIRVESVRQKRRDKRAKGPRVPGSVWDVSRLAGSHKKRGRVDWHPAQLPPEPLERIILCSTHSGDTVLDLFAGSGSMLRACRKHGRRFIGIDDKPEYCRRMVGDNDD